MIHVDHATLLPRIMRIVTPNITKFRYMLCTVCIYARYSLVTRETHLCTPYNLRASGQTVQCTHQCESGFAHNVCLHLHPTTESATRTTFTTYMTDDTLNGHWPTCHTSLAHQQVPTVGTYETHAQILPKQGESTYPRATHGTLSDPRKVRKHTALQRNHSSEAQKQNVHGIVEGIVKRTRTGLCEKTRGTPKWWEHSFDCRRNATPLLTTKFRVLLECYPGLLGLGKRIRALGKRPSKNPLRNLLRNPLRNPSTGSKKKDPKKKIMQPRIKKK